MIEVIKPSDDKLTQETWRFDFWTTTTGEPVIV